MATQSRAKLLCINPDHVAGIWPKVRDLIRRAIERTKLSDFAMIEADVLSGKHLLWVAWNGQTVDAAATTQLIKVGDRKICVVVACGGSDMPKWLPLIDGIEAFARNEGCVEMRIGGRKGWERVLSGYRARYVTLQKELN